MNNLSMLVGPLILFWMSIGELVQLLSDVCLLITIITPSVKHLTCQTCTAYEHYDHDQSAV